MKTRYLLIVFSLLFLAACQPSIDEFTPSDGSADFSRYLAVGDFWTAGFADGSLYKSGQENSFPSILAGQFLPSGNDFRQPLMVDDYGFGISTGAPLPKLVLGYKTDCLGVTGLSPIYPEVQVDPANFASVAANGPFNNLGMPGLKSIYVGIDILATQNPYFGRFASSPTATVLGEIPPVDATFYTLMLGMFDVQYFAMLGGVGDVITSVPQFTASIGATLDVLKANGAKGAVANVPDILDAPYFRTIPYNALPVPDQASADMLNMAYFQLNQAIKQAGSTDTIHFTIGANPLLIEALDPQHPWGMRQIKPTELVLFSLPQDSLKCSGWGSAKPVPANFILDESEINAIEQAITDYNAQIELLVADDPNIVLVDLHQAMKDVVAGLEFDGVHVDSKFVTGNFYSLDGLNPTPRGSAVVAYYFIEAINAKFGAKISQVVVSDYEGVVLP